MPSTKRVQFPPWINSSALKGWQAESAIFKDMTVDVVTAAAIKAGAVVKTAAQDIIFTESDLSAFQSVAESTTVWADDGNVYVGVPEGSPVKAQADQMNEQTYPVIETAFDMVGTEATQTFETELRFGGGLT